MSGERGPVRAGNGVLEVATLGGGCFWCLEAVYEQLVGVTGVASGYAGGTIPSPTYEQVCTGGTGHAEVVQVTFDPAQVSYAELKSGLFSFKGQDIPAVPLSSYIRALEIATMLKDWIEKGEFLLTQPQEMLPTVAP